MSRWVMALGVVFVVLAGAAMFAVVKAVSP